MVVQDTQVKKVWKVRKLDNSERAVLVVQSLYSQFQSLFPASTLQILQGKKKL